MTKRTTKPNRPASAVDPFLPGQVIAAGSGNQPHTRDLTSSQLAGPQGEKGRRAPQAKGEGGPQAAAKRQRSPQAASAAPGRAADAKRRRSPQGAAAGSAGSAPLGQAPGTGGGPSGQVALGQAKRVIGYRRISKDNGNGLGLAAQTAAIKDQAKRLGVPVAEVFTDRGVSGAAPIKKRLALLAALGELRSGDVLVIARRDRLARDVMVAGWIEKEVKRRGAAIVSAAGDANGDGPYDKIMRTIINAFAELERDLVVARNRAVVEVQRARGLKLGHCPYGFRGGPDIDDRGKPITRLVKDQDEQKIIRRVKRLRAGGASLRAISAKLAKDGQLNRQGRPFGAPSISRLL